MDKCKEWRDQWKNDMEELNKSMQRLANCFTPEDVAFNQKMQKKANVYRLEKKAQKLFEELEK